MTSGEVVFLAVGLLLGIAGATLVVASGRGRPGGGREVRVTISPGSVPIRGSTLAIDPFLPPWTGPAPYGPADRRLTDRSIGRSLSTFDAGRDGPLAPAPSLGRTASPAATPDPAAEPVPPPPGSGSRTPVPSVDAGGRLVVPADEAARDASTPSPGSADPASTGPEPPRPLVAVPIEAEVDGLFEAVLAARSRAAVTPVRRGRRAGARSGRLRGQAGPDRPAGAAVAIGSAVALDRAIEPTSASAETGSGRPGPARGKPGSASGGVEPADGPCAELRTIADDRCAVADRARTGSETARDALRTAQRTYDDHLGRADAAEADADPRRVRAAKEAAQATFRQARDAARTRADLDQAAAAWLATINDINTRTRDATGLVARERAAANALAASLERLAVEADAARIAAEAAEEACVAARQAAADCQEAAVAEATAAAAPVARPAGPRVPVPADDDAGEAETLAGAPGERAARIVRILRGDEGALTRTAAELGAGDAAERQRWGSTLRAFAAAVTAQAIDAGAIDPPEEHPFWSLFQRSQRRDVVSALASLGYRFDGSGGFVDGRSPSQRDLSLAIGYGGLDPMRIRHWPTEPELQQLLAGARVASDEYLVGSAGGLTLGELIALLGRRADGLTDLWNQWGRVRPLLLATD